MNDIEIGKRIRDLRRKNNIKQEKLAKLTGIAQSNLSNIEKGKRSVPKDALLAFSKVFNVPVKYITDGEEFETDIEERLSKLEKKVDKFTEMLNIIISELQSKKQ